MGGVQPGRKWKRVKEGEGVGHGGGTSPCLGKRQVRLGPGRGWGRREERGAGRREDPAPPGGRERGGREREAPPPQGPSLPPRGLVVHRGPRHRPPRPPPSCAPSPRAAAAGPAGAGPGAVGAAPREGPPLVPDARSRATRRARVVALGPGAARQEPARDAVRRGPAGGEGRRTPRAEHRAARVAVVGRRADGRLGRAPRRAVVRRTHQVAVEPPPAVDARLGLAPDGHGVGDARVAPAIPAPVFRPVGHLCRVFACTSGSP